CAPDDRERAESIGAASGVTYRVVPAGMSIIDAAAIIQRLGLLITPDTSIPHIARSYNIPVVGLYSRDMRNTASWRPYGQIGGVVLAESPANIFDITPGMVLDEVETVLSEYEQVRV
ncbi:MAG: glycosyltransferase family 9 protein, partial [Candidatus Zixiibacteriota bacterium]